MRTSQQCITSKFYLEAVISLHDTAYLQGLTEPDEFQHANILRLLEDQQFFNKFLFDWLTLPSVRGYAHFFMICTERQYRMYVQCTARHR